MKDNKWQEIRLKILERDKVCQLSRVLTAPEWDYLREYYWDDYKWLSKTLDCAHIYPKDTHPHLKYDESNLLLLCRYFHTLLDGFKHPITRKNINKEERLKWYLRMKKT